MFDRLFPVTLQYKQYANRMPFALFAIPFPLTTSFEEPRLTPLPLFAVTLFPLKTLLRRSEVDAIKLVCCYVVSRSRCCCWKKRKARHQQRCLLLRCFCSRCCCWKEEESPTPIMLFPAVTLFPAHDVVAGRRAESPTPIMLFAVTLFPLYAMSRPCCWKRGKPERQ